MPTRTRTKKRPATTTPTTTEIITTSTATTPLPSVPYSPGVTIASETHALTPPGALVPSRQRRGSRASLDAATPAPQQIPVRVSQPAGPTSAIARPLYPREERGAPPDASTALAVAKARRHSRRVEPEKLTPEAALDILVYGIWSAAVAANVGLSWRDEDWRRVTFDPGALLDAFATLAWEDTVSFPLPGSPRYDGAGGGHRVAADGSPGIPGAWLAWLDRDDHQALRRRVASMPAGRLARSPLLLAQLALAREAPLLWRIYGARVLAGRSARDISQVVSLPLPKVQKLLGKARLALLSYVALYQGEATEEEYAALVATLRA